MKKLIIFLLLVLTLAVSYGLLQAQRRVLGICGGVLEPLEVKDGRILSGKEVSAVTYEWIGTKIGEFIHITGETYEVCSGAATSGTVNRIIIANEGVYFFVDDSERGQDPEAHSSGVWFYSSDDQTFTRLGLSEVAVYDGDVTMTSLYAVGLEGYFERPNGSSSFVRIPVRATNAPSGYHAILADEENVLLLGALGRQGDGINTGIYKPLENNGWYRYSVDCGVRSLVLNSEGDALAACDRESNGGLFIVDMDTLGDPVLIETPHSHLRSVDHSPGVSSQGVTIVGDYTEQGGADVTADYVTWYTLANEAINSVFIPVVFDQTVVYMLGTNNGVILGEFTF